MLLILALNSPHIRLSLPPRTQTYLPSFNYWDGTPPSTPGLRQPKAAIVGRGSHLKGKRALPQSNWMRGSAHRPRQEQCGFRKQDQHEQASFHGKPERKHDSEDRAHGHSLHHAPHDGYVDPDRRLSDTGEDPGGSGFATTWQTGNTGTHGRNAGKAELRIRKHSPVGRPGVRSAGCRAVSPGSCRLQAKECSIQRKVSFPRVEKITYSKRSSLRLHCSSGQETFAYGLRPQEVDLYRSLHLGCCCACPMPPERIHATVHLPYCELMDRNRCE